MSKVYKTNIDSLIALCHILDDYENFNEKLSNLLTMESKKNIAYDLSAISNGKIVFGLVKIKNFYNENKLVIDTINNFYNISEFIYTNYDSNGQLKEMSDLNFFYKYFLDHKDELNIIISVLEKMKVLGLYNLQFGEEINFTDKKYDVYTDFNKNFRISYLENMKIIPNYQEEVVKYTTTGSNYEIVVTSYINKNIKYSGTIIVNNLLFNPNNLPKEISKEVILDEIINLKNACQNECNAVRNSVDLSVSIDDLYSQYYITCKAIENIGDIENKDEIKDALLEIKSCLEQLQIISSTYNENIIDNSTITKERLKEEKHFYLSRRFWDSCEYDI